MNKNTHSTTPVPTSESRPYTELETRLIALLEQLADDYRDFQDEKSNLGKGRLSEMQQHVIMELNKHPSQQAMVKNLPAYVKGVYAILGCEDPSDDDIQRLEEGGLAKAEAWDCLKNPDGETTVTKAQVFDHEGNPVD